MTTILQVQHIDILPDLTKFHHVVKYEEVLMKKIMLVFMALLIIGSFSACNNVNITDTNALDLIFEVDNNLYNTEKSFNHRNTISNNAEQSKEKNPPSNKKFTFNDNENEFVYYDTLFYPVGQKKVYRYSEDGKDDNVILLNEDGSVNSILYKYTRLDIYDKSDTSDVLIELKNELNKLVDVSKYEYVDEPEYDDALEIYDYLFYNMEEGYITDYMRVSVSADGHVFGLSINNLMSEDFVLNINKVLEEEMINFKLADIYSTESTEYKSYNTVFPPQVVVYDNELYIQYYVSANYIDSNEKESVSWLNCILIPVSLISGNSCNEV